MHISNRLPPPAPTLHSHSSGRYPYLRQRRSKWWGCGAVVRPINRTNGGLTALCALREEDQPPAAGQAERAGGQERPGVGAVGYSTPFKWLLQSVDPFTAWIYFHTRETEEGGGGRMNMGMARWSIYAWTLKIISTKTELSIIKIVRHWNKKYIVMFSHQKFHQRIN